MSATRILIADDHHIVADSLSILLSTVDDIEVMGIVNNGWQVLNFLEINEIDVVISDLHMPLLNGIDMTIKIREQFPKVKVIMLTMSEEANFIREALQAGIYGYVMKSAERPELLKAIRTVATGEKYFSERVIKRLAEIPNPNNADGKTSINDENPLTAREIEILKLIVSDKSNLEISEKLELSITTVETHRRNLMKKIGANTAIGLMRWALKHRLIDE